MGGMTGWRGGAGMGRRVVAAALVAMMALAGCQNRTRATWSAAGGSPTGTAAGAPSGSAGASGGTGAPAQSWRCARSTAPCPVPGKVIVGAYLDLSGKTMGQSLALRHEQFGRYPRIVHLFYNWTDGLP